MLCCLDSWAWLLFLHTSPQSLRGAVSAHSWFTSKTDLGLHCPRGRTPLPSGLVFQLFLNLGGHYGTGGSCYSSTFRNELPAQLDQDSRACPSCTVLLLPTSGRKMQASLVLGNQTRAETLSAPPPRKWLIARSPRHLLDRGKRPQPAK